jgi:hypothetical protein
VFHTIPGVPCRQTERLTQISGIFEKTIAMEPIPVFYDHVSRSSIAVRPKQPLLDWINALYPGFPEHPSDGTVYLVKPMDEHADLEKWLKTNYKKIFENELNELHTDEADWPKKRDRKTFDEWFDTSIHTFVVDMVDGFIKKY